MAFDSTTFFHGQAVDIYSEKQKPGPQKIGPKTLEQANFRCFVKSDLQ